MMRFAAGLAAYIFSICVVSTASAQQEPDSPTVLRAPQPSIQENADFLAANLRKKGVIRRASGLQFRIIRNGFGERPRLTDTVTVYYTGRLINGVVFDGTSSGLPASLAVNKVIPGWTEALLSMRVGDRWEVVIPPGLAYGSRGKGDIVGPNQTLIFDLELLGTKPAPKKGEKGYVPEPGEEPDR